MWITLGAGERLALAESTGEIWPAFVRVRKLRRRRIGREKARDRCSRRPTVSFSCREWPFFISAVSEQPHFAQVSSPVNVYRRAFRGRVVPPRTFWTRLKMSWVIRGWCEPLAGSLSALRPTPTGPFSVCDDTAFPTMSLALARPGTPLLSPVQPVRSAEAFLPVVSPPVARGHTAGILWRCRLHRAAGCSRATA